MRIVITGAAGNIGRLVTEDLARDHALVLIDRRPVSGHASVVADLARDPAALWRLGRRGWDRYFEGVDVVIHLAALLHPASIGPLGWRRIRRCNIEGTWHVLEAANRYRVPRFILGSSLWAIQAALFDEQQTGGLVDSSTSSRPLLTYGLSKAFGETAGRMFVDEKRLRSFIAVRIGYCPQDEQHLGVPWLRRRWVGRMDITSLLRRCAEVDLEGFHIVYGISRLPDPVCDLSHTRALLGWDPVEMLPSRGAPV